MRTRIPTMVVMALVAATVGCGGDGDIAAMPVPAMTEAEIQQLEQEATEFATEVVMAWPNMVAFEEALDEDAVYADPTGDLYFVGKDPLLANERLWAENSDFTVDVQDVYLSADGPAYRSLLPGLEMSSDPDAPVLGSFDVYQLRDGKIVGWDEWWSADWLEFHGAGCFRVDGCSALRETVDRYVAAWTSRDAAAVAALYSADAVFRDSLFDLAADGAEAIGDLAVERFGSTGDVTIAVLERYAWTDGPGAPTVSEPERGRLLGVAIHYRAEVGDDDAHHSQAGVITLVLGTRHDTHIDSDAEYLIHDEDVYHAPATLLAALQPQR